MDDMLRQYEDQGYIGPYAAFTESEMQEIIPAVRAEMDRQTTLPGWRNRHFDWDLARRITTAPAIVERLVDIMGPDLILWRTNFFDVPVKQGLPWHQDEYHTLLSDPFNHITAHLAITEASPENCLLIIPGSHRFSKDSMEAEGFRHFEHGQVEQKLGTPRYRRVIGNSPEPVQLILKPGEFIVFHPSLMHGSADFLTGPRPKPSLLTRVKNRLTGSRQRNEAPAPNRLAFGLRATVPDNRVLPAAFAETLPREDHCVVLHGDNTTGLNETPDW